MAKKKLLEVKDLKTSFFTAVGEVKAVDGVSFHLNEQEIIAIVGESGCGKSVSQMSVIQLIQSPPGKILGGQVIFDGKNLLDFPPESQEMRDIRGAGISMVFQEPMTSLNPILTIGQQLTEVIMTHTKCSRKEAWDIGVESLKAVGIPDAEERMADYPFQLSGGMCQRAMTATAIACRSKIIIADEPTTALDVTTQAQVMELLLSLVEKFKTSVIIVTHNLGLVTRYADRVYVMYAGKIVESGTTEDILMHSRHPYTLGLLDSVPRLDSKREQDLLPIQGAPPRLHDLPPGCTFAPRCQYVYEKCRQEYPNLRQVGEKSHFAACHLDVGVNGR
ncbi:MAG: ABC transporter ATP-binding protein [Anaerolineales bacterium]|jgi:oligopeptide/dipeptide ABC transporter ATP-binding protein